GGGRGKGDARVPVSQPEADPLSAERQRIGGRGDGRRGAAPRPGGGAGIAEHGRDRDLRQDRSRDRGLAGAGGGRIPGRLRIAGIGPGAGRAGHLPLAGLDLVLHRRRGRVPGVDDRPGHAGGGGGGRDPHRSFEAFHPRRGDWLAGTARFRFRGGGARPGEVAFGGEGLYRAGWCSDAHPAFRLMRSAASMPMPACPHCGAETPESAHFCASCGLRTGAGAAADPELPAGPPPRWGGRNVVLGFLIAVAVLALIFLVAMIYFIKNTTIVTSTQGNSRVESPIGVLATSNDPIKIAKGLGLDVYPGAAGEKSAQADLNANSIASMLFRTPATPRQVIEFYHV